MRSVLPINASYVLGVAAVFSLVSNCSRLAYDSGSNALTVIAIRTAFVGAALWVFLNARRIPWRLPAGERYRALALGALLAFSTFALNKALEVIPVAIAILIYYTYPLLTSIVSWLTRTERFSLRVAATLVLAFSGLALALQVKEGPLDAGGLAYAIAASVGWGTMMYLTGRAFRGGDSRPRTLHMMLSAAVLFLLACALAGDVAFPATREGWIGFVGVPFLYGVAIIGTLAAVGAIGAMKTSFYMNFEPVATIVFSALVLDQFMTLMQLAGAGLVVVALLIFRMPGGKLGLTDAKLDRRQP